jgi:predicted transcriptional regulator
MLYNLDRSAAEDLAERLRSAPGITVRRALMNMVAGKLLLDWEANDRETIERWLTEQGFDAPISS